MKLNEIMKIKRKITDDSEVTIGAIAPINYGFNLCLDEIGSMNLLFDEHKIAQIFSDVRYDCLGKVGITEGQLSKLQTKALLEALPTILTIEADKENL